MDRVFIAGLLALLVVVALIALYVGRQPAADSDVHHAADANHSGTLTHA